MAKSLKSTVQWRFYWQVFKHMRKQSTYSVCSITWLTKVWKPCAGRKKKREVTKRLTLWMMRKIPLNKLAIPKARTLTAYKDNINLKWDVRKKLHVVFVCTYELKLRNQQRKIQHRGLWWTRLDLRTRYSSRCLALLMRGIELEPRYISATYLWVTWELQLEMALNLKQTKKKKRVRERS